MLLATVGFVKHDNTKFKKQCPTLNAARQAANHSHGPDRQRVHHEGVVQIQPRRAALRLRQRRHLPGVRPLQPLGRFRVCSEGRALHEPCVVDARAVGGQELAVLGFTGLWLVGWWLGMGIRRGKEGLIDKSNA